MSLKRFIFLFAIAAFSAGFFRACAFEGIYIATASMEPTLPVGGHYWLDKMTLRFREPRRGEVIIFFTPIPPYDDMGKRVIAIAGDTIEIRNKKIYLNGNLQAEPYTRYTRAYEKLAGDNLGPLSVPEGHLLVLGDNRDESNDSAVWKHPETGERVPFVPLGNVRGLLRGVY